MSSVYGEVLMLLLEIFFILHIQKKKYILQNIGIYTIRLYYSLLAGFCITIFMGFLSYRLYNQLNNWKSTNLITSIHKNKLLLIGFFLGFLVHLIEDIPTPASTWGGVNFFYPSKLYIRGIGVIWWWSNYDIFLIVVRIWCYL